MIILSTTYKTKTIRHRSIEEKEEFGDWQTDINFAKAVCLSLKKTGVNPKVIIEPTCGKGNFIKAALSVFDSIKFVIGIDIYKPYIDELSEYLKKLKLSRTDFNYQLYNDDIFKFNFDDIKSQISHLSTLIIGNPPWVTNSDLGQIKSTNIPDKSNYKKNRGIEAITGKGNFDIAESICNLLFITFGQLSHTRIALLIKNSVVKNILMHQNCDNAYNISDIKQLSFDARKEFGVSVSASLFTTEISNKKDKVCSVYDFYSNSFISSYGWIDNIFVSNIQAYTYSSGIEGTSQLVWRSGLKHDCSKVMELTKHNNHFENGLHEIVDVEENTIYPFLKSSDIGNGYAADKAHKFVILPQKSISESTDALRNKYPRTYQYLLKHAELLDGRKSIIYKGRPRFCVFGIGNYSFQKYKIVISSLYKSLKFSLVSPINKTVLLDDTCYMLGFDDYKYATITLYILNSKVVQDFLKTIYLPDAKRIINRDLLMRIDLLKAVNLVDLKNFTSDEVSSYKKWLKSKIIPIQQELF